MIDALMARVRSGLSYVKDHPNLVLVLVLFFLLPLLFLYTNQQFLEAGRSNQDRLQKDRVGLMHDTFASLLYATDFNAASAQTELERIAAVNPDILEFRVAKRQGADIVPVAALNTDVIGQPEETSALYKDAAVRVDESIIFEFNTSQGREWYAFRTIETENDELYFIYTRVSLAAVDALFAQTSRNAMYTLVFVYLFVIILAYWHIKMTDYRYLYQEVKKANQMKDMFTNMIAHELRAPLTAIRGYSSMIEEKTEGDMHTHAVRVRESTERLLAIVNDLLDVARIQSGKLSVEKTTGDVSTIINKVLDELRVSGTEKNIVLSAEGAGEPHEAIIDPKRFHQALTNLVSNSIKYTKEGTITVSVSDSYDEVEIRVKDTGMGISYENQKKLFAPFFRVQSQDVSQITGTGLGMWITKQLVELMGGTIAVESIKGVGTHIVVKFPKPKAS